MSENIVAFYHSSFTGGSRNTSQLLHHLATSGSRVDAYFTKLPDHLRASSNGVVTHDIGSRQVHSDVVARTMLGNYGMAEAICRDLRGRDAVTLLGAYLMPYGEILHDVKTQLVADGASRPTLVLHPVGSDMWQVGPQMRGRIRWLLDSPLVDRVISYSDRFIAEVKEFYRVEREMQVVPPVLNTERFFPLTREGVSTRRRELGLDADTFIMHHHSSMKRIKCPEVVIQIASEVANVVRRKTILIMVGPIPGSALHRHRLALHPAGSRGWVKYESYQGNLTILWTGVGVAVEHLLQIADVEVNASLHDSFNMALMEAMGCGVPVVSSDIVGMREHIEASGGGMCFPATRMEFDALYRWCRTRAPARKHFRISDAIAAVAEIAALGPGATKMGRSGSRYVAETFTAQRALRAWRAGNS